jgi:hypothetical protein
MAVELLARVHAEIEERMADLRPAVEEYERLSGATDALGAKSAEAVAPATASRAKQARAARRAPSAASRAKRARAAKRAPSAAEQAIAAALEHGSHTVSELVLVSALPAADIRAGLRPLLASGAVTRAKRDGRAAYALTSAA